jgi:phage terminase large subunit
VRLIINQGGQGSSKTFSILQVIAGLCMKEKLLVSICSFALPHLKAGCMRDWEKVLESFGVNVAEIKNKTENSYQVGKSSVEFFGIEGNEAKAMGARRSILFINECNRKITYEVYEALASRSEVVFLDYNPYLAGWVQDMMRDFPGKFELIHSTYKDNPYLSPIERAEIEKYKEKPEYNNLWKVYGLGELGSLAGAILTNWRYLKEGEVWGEGLSYGYGLDFGYNDPTALIKVSMDHKGKRIFCDEKIYLSGITTSELKDIMVRVPIRMNELVIADSSAPALIKELQRYFNIEPCNKGRFTLADGLKLMQEYEIIITPGSLNLSRELENYIWNDKKAGIPIGAFNHAIDAIRYYFMKNVRIGTGAAQVWHMGISSGNPSAGSFSRYPPGTFARKK